MVFGSNKYQFNIEIIQKFQHKVEVHDIVNVARYVSNTVIQSCVPIPSNNESIRTHIGEGL